MTKVNELVFENIEYIAEWFELDGWLKFLRNNSIKTIYEIDEHSQSEGLRIASYIRMWHNTPSFIKMMDPTWEPEDAYNWQLIPTEFVKFNGWGNQYWNFWWHSMDGLKFSIRQTDQQNKTVYILEFDNNSETEKDL